MTSALSSSLESLLSAHPLEQEALLSSLSEEEATELLQMLPLWRPQPGPQTLAYQSQADILFYGGAAGGGKTDLVLGLAGTQHRKSVVFRREFPRLTAIVERSRKIYSPGGASFTSSPVSMWRFTDDRVVRFSGLQQEEDKSNWQGQPHDLYAFDEITEFSETQVRFVIGWNRTTEPGQRCRVVFTGNPPTNSDGDWVIKFFAPWLDEHHPNPAKPGELRYFTTDAGKDIELADGSPILVGKEWVRPLSRTFIPARLSDNAYQGAEYLARLQAMPEPLRSKMLYGDFRAGREDDAYQVIPTAWVRAAQERWRKRSKPTTPMTTLGVDVARGGKDETTLAPRYGNYIAELIVRPGADTPDGDSIAVLVLPVIAPTTQVQIDVISVGSSPYDALKKLIGARAVPMNASEGSDAMDAPKVLGFVNQRAEWWWRTRESLDPRSGQDVALPPDPQLFSDLCAPRWKLAARGIQIESKDEIKKRIHRSPDRGDAVVMAIAPKTIPGAGLLEFMRLQAEAKKADKK
jgi:hypothetical protein